MKQPIQQPSRTITRRDFVGRALTTAGVFTTAPAFLRGQNLNSKLNLAFLGAGGRGNANLGELTLVPGRSAKAGGKKAVDPAAGPHPDENVTVLTGTFHIAMGDKLDKAKGDAIGPGGFFRAEQGMQHYGWTTSPTVIQIHGMGPFAINYVNPADDPRNATTATK